MRKISSSAEEVAQPEVPRECSTIVRNPDTLVGRLFDLHGHDIGDATCLKCVSPVCHTNPDIQTSEGKICPVDALSPPSGSQAIRISNACIGCGLCAIRCPVGAISVTEFGAEPVSTATTTVNEVVPPDVHESWLTERGTSLSSLRPFEVEKLATSFAGRAQRLKATEFYPLVASLFRSLGIDAYAADAGVNNERIDVMLPDSDLPIPAEVKSYTEVDSINMKSIQQALENLLSLSSDRSLDSLPESTSLAVGFGLPPERSGVHDALDAIHRAYGVNIVLVTTYRLYELALQHETGETFNRRTLEQARRQL